jgi:Flp pilus assembly pilin Flp
MKTLRSFLSDERGLETVEYAIIAGLIVVGVIVVIKSIGTKVKAKFDTLDGALDS